MALHITPNDSGDGIIVAETGNGVEFGDAVKYFSDAKIGIVAGIYRQMLMARSQVLTSKLPDAFFLAKGRESWQRIEKEIRATVIPSSFISLLNSKSKSEQEKLLRNQTLTSFQYAHMLFASKEYDYTFSSYLSEKLPDDVKSGEMPKLIRLEKDKIFKRGATPYSDGRLKGIIQQRKVIVARILDRMDEWHCFFQTYKSMQGQETWRNGQPHIHYISDKWGISRADLVRQIRDGRHPSTKIHITFVK